MLTCSYINEWNPMADWKVIQRFQKHYSKLRLVLMCSILHCYNFKGLIKAFKTISQKIFLKYMCVCVCDGLFGRTKPVLTGQPQQVSGDRK